MRSTTWSFLLCLAGAIPALGAPNFKRGELSKSPDGTCGGSTGFTCEGSWYGNCCGASGKCGSDGDTCGSGCQDGFGYCSDTKGAPSPDGTCGGDVGYTCKGTSFGGCCSKWGFCGDTPLHCGEGCQDDSGSCSPSKVRRDDSTPVTASDPKTFPSACPGVNGTTYIATTGAEYMITCNADHYGGDLSSLSIAGMGSCMETCANTAGCVSVSYIGGIPRGFCYLKKSIGKEVPNGNVRNAVFVRNRIIASSSSSGTVPSSTGSAVSSTPSSGGSATVTSVMPTATAKICPSMNGTEYVDSCGATYVIECGIDHSGGDIHGGGNYLTYGDCLSRCSATNGCIGVSWVRGSPKGACYLKGTPKPAEADSRVYGARQISGCKAASSSMSASITAPPASSTTCASATVSVSRNSTSPSACTSAPAINKDWLPDCIPCDGKSHDKFCGYTAKDDSYKVTPKTCKVVYYELDITNTTVAPDGVSRPALLINGQMPGPLIRASWGDTVVVRVNNKMQNNGTSIHWHGMRQLNNNEHDGVVSITQCPIAPGESMTYRFVAENYGTSWYHSHFAIQTWEGVFGPVIIDGPHSDDSFDEDLGMVVIQDWSHVPVDAMYDTAQDARLDPNGRFGLAGGPRVLDTGLINGKNVWGADGTSNQTGSRTEFTFTKGRSYLLRVVNGAMQSTFKFYIDGHKFTVISNDFVPIVPYETDVLNINIGERYNIIVKADRDIGNYWMRADNQQTCAQLKNANGKDIKAIVRYAGADPAPALPTSTAYNYTEECVDEPYDKLVPYAPMTVGTTDVQEGNFDVSVGVNSMNLFKWYITSGGVRTTFMADHEEPTLVSILETGNAPDTSGNLKLDLPKAGEWVYVIITSNSVPVPHPMHLHGHDFFILAQGRGSWNPSVPLKLDNPPRRDTVLLPSDKPGVGAYIVVAFQTDNPGAWLMHCHIGWHTAMGFALQLVEMQDQIAGTVTDSCKLKDTCAGWKKYIDNGGLVRDDSGV